MPDIGGERIVSLPSVAASYEASGKFLISASASIVNLPIAIANEFRDNEEDE